MKEALHRTLTDAGVKFVRLLWCDNANVIRAKAGHTAFLDQFIDEGINITVAQQALPVMYDAVVPDSGLGPVGEVRLMPDWRTLTILPYAEGQAQVISDMLVSKTREIWEQCPRGFLRRQVEKLGTGGLTLMAAFENEFFLLHQTPEGRIAPADNTVFAATGAMNRHHLLINALAEALVAQGVQVEAYYPESGPGQHELPVRYAEAMQAADQQIIFRETVRGVAAQNGLTASFVPKIFEDKAGSGCHLNFSLWRGGANVSGDAGHATGLSAEARAFVAGVLAHLPGLCALTIPSINSYRRIRPHFWAGAFRCWGTANREAAVRVSRTFDGAKASRMEFKTIDATANPYLALGAVIAAGLDGLERGLELPEEVTVDPGNIPEDERQRRGIDLLPQNLGQAVKALEQDTVLQAALGQGLCQSFIAIRRYEWQNLKDLTLEEERELLLERY